jgi:hypothetical protein
MTTPDVIINQPANVKPDIMQEPDMFDAMLKKQQGIDDKPVVDKVAATGDKKIPVGDKMSPTEDKVEAKAKDEVAVSSEEIIDKRVQSKEATPKPKTKKEEDIAEKAKRLEKIAYDQQRFARHEQQKVKDTLKAVEELAEAGDLDEDSANKLLAHLKRESKDKANETFTNNIIVENPQPLSKYQAILRKAEEENKIFATYVEVTEDINARKKLEAFDIYLREASEQEIEVLEEEFSHCKTPMELLKKVVAKGNEFLDDGLSEFYDHGGFRQYFKAKNETVKKLQKDIDKLNKKLLQYEDQSTAGNWLGSDSSGSETDKHKDTGDMFDDMLARQEFVSARRR